MIAKSRTDSSARWRDLDVSAVGLIPSLYPEHPLPRARGRVREGAFSSLAVLRKSTVSNPLPSRLNGRPDQVRTQREGG
jgi:hypothetical protein